MLIIPIVVSVAIAAGNRFTPGKKWLLMRGAAESIKREIFRYRTRAGDYRHADREAVLALKVEDITRGLARTEVNTGAFEPYLGKIPPVMFAAEAPDDGLSLLSPERYLALRVVDQLRYYRRSALKLHRALVTWQGAILLLGGLGTLLAALNCSVWVAVTTAAVTTVTTHLGYRRSRQPRPTTKWQLTSKTSTVVAGAVAGRSGGFRQPRQARRPRRTGPRVRARRLGSEDARCAGHPPQGPGSAQAARQARCWREAFVRRRLSPDVADVDDVKR